MVTHAAKHVLFGSKAETLERVAPLLQNASVLPLTRFRVEEWRARRASLVEAISNTRWGKGRLIVRSSTAHEDSPDAMEPGGYLSVPGVVGPDALGAAVDAVIESYTAKGSLETDDIGRQHVLVQPMLENATTTGVMFTSDPNTGAPYLVINYEGLGDTSAVTSGTSAHLCMFYCWKHAPGPPRDPRMRRLAELARELEAIFQRQALDVEYAFDGRGELYLFQVRPLPVAGEREDPGLESAVDIVAGKVRRASMPHPYLLGRRTVFGVMPDWNPAEILGARPRPLALSLYRKLITDMEWADQRRRYGYRDVRGFPLLLDFCGVPYVDVRASANSLVPAGLDDRLAERLVDHYVDRLTTHPELHDKVEFDVFFTCYSFTLPERLSRRTGTLFTEEERTRILDSLRDLTNALMDEDHPALRTDVESIASLPERFTRIRDSALEPPARIYWLLEDCRRHGTRPFAGYARLGFIATELLRSLVARGVLPQEYVTRLMASLDTPTNRMLRDRAELSREEFLNRYGFLRPGTYDIRSPRYDEAPDTYFTWSHRPPPARTAARPPLPPGAARRIDDLLRKHGLKQSAEGLLAFITSSIERRENSKFEFSRHLSEALRIMKSLGEQVGLSADDLSYASAEDIGELYRGASNSRSVLSSAVDEGRRKYELTRRIVLPPVITSSEDVFSFRLTPGEPNFITQGRTSGPVATADTDTAELAGKILLLPSGDPGYDWVFSKGITGFITRYGGANSHMAIRAHQLGVPAVIGAGDVLYEQWSEARHIMLDCLNRRVEVVM